MTTPIHPVSKTALIPVIRTHADGTQQRYWISLRKFMDDRERGVMMQRIPRETHTDVTVPEQEAPVYQMEFIENMIDFGVAGLEFKKDKYEAELIAKVEIKKNGKLIRTYPVKVSREMIARAILKKVLSVN